MVYYNMGDEIPSQQLGCTIMMGETSHVPREEVRYRNEATPRAGTQEM